MADITIWEDNAMHELTSNGHWRARNLDNIEWLSGTTPVSKADIQAKAAELEAADAVVVTQKATDKASAKAKLIAGEALTEAEVDTIVL